MKLLNFDNNILDDPVSYIHGPQQYRWRMTYLSGGYVSCKITTIRLVIGSWCLLTLVLLNVYNGVLISYVTTTHREPTLINSIDDVASDSNIRIIVNKGLGPDLVLSVMGTIHIPDSSCITVYNV